MWFGTPAKQDKLKNPAVKKKTTPALGSSRPVSGMTVKEGDGANSYFC